MADYNPIRTYEDFRKGSEGTKIFDGTFNSTKFPFTIPGNGISDYATTIAESFLWVNDNFAGPWEPLSPINGQFWFDTSNGLKIYDSELDEWSLVSSSSIDLTNIEVDFTPSVEGLVIGNPDYRYANLHCSVLNVGSDVIFTNTYGGEKNITITEDGYVNAPTNIGSYPHNGESSTDAIDNLISNIFDPSEVTTWGFENATVTVNGTTMLAYPTFTPGSPLRSYIDLTPISGQPHDKIIIYLLGVDSLISGSPLDYTSVPDMQLIIKRPANINAKMEFPLTYGSNLALNFINGIPNFMHEVNEVSVMQEPTSGAPSVNMLYTLSITQSDIPGILDVIFSEREY